MEQVLFKQTFMLHQ